MKLYRVDGSIVAYFVAEQHEAQAEAVSALEEEAAHHGIEPDVVREIRYVSELSDKAAVTIPWGRPYDAEDETCAEFLAHHPKPLPGQKALFTEDGA